MEDISEFLINKGYKLEYKIINPKGRGKFQFDCGIDRKPTEEETKEMEEKLGLKVLKNNFKKGTLTMLIKPNEKTEKEKRIIIDLNINDVVDMIYKKDLSRQELKDVLNMFQNSAYAKGYKTHKVAIKKLLENI